MGSRRILRPHESNRGALHRSPRTPDAVMAAPILAERPWVGQSVRVKGPRTTRPKCLSAEEALIRLCLGAVRSGHLRPGRAGRFIQIPHLGRRHPAWARGLRGRRPREVRQRLIHLGHQVLDISVLGERYIGSVLCGIHPKMLGNAVPSERRGGFLFARMLICRSRCARGQPVASSDSG